MDELTNKEKIGEMVINKLSTEFVNNLLMVESTMEDMYFDNLGVEADLKDGRVLKISLKQPQED